MGFLDEYDAILKSEALPPPHLKGDGIIFGLFENHDNAHASVIVSINILRDLLNWEGGIQVWHVGSAPKMCRNFQVEFIDATRVQEHHPGHIRSWCLKSYALEHSGYARAMWLDWDAYACMNPRKIFQELDSVDFYYWRNGPHWDDIANKKLIGQVTANPMPHSVQGGVYFLNCVTGWKMLQLQRCWDTHEAETWGSNYDQDGWLLACTAGAGTYHCNLDNPWVWPAWVSYYDGRPYFVHRCGDKLWRNKLARFNRMLPIDEIVERLYIRALGPRYAELQEPKPIPQAERIRQARIARGIPA